jgi:hypothetical protein
MARLRAAGCHPGLDRKRDPPQRGPRSPVRLRGRHMATTAQPIGTSRSTRALDLGAPRGGRARSAIGRRSSFHSPASPVAHANALSRYTRKVSNHPLVACEDPAGWRRGAQMNLRAMAAADAHTPERQRRSGVVSVGSQVQIRRKDDTAYYCGVETCGSVWLCPVCSPKIRHRRTTNCATHSTPGGGRPRREPGNDHGAA